MGEIQKIGEDKRGLERSDGIAGDRKGLDGIREGHMGYKRIRRKKRSLKVYQEGK